MKNICEHFENCGGCSILDKKYEEQIMIKKNILRELFSKWNIEPQIIKSPEQYYYRHKVQLPFSFTGNNKNNRVLLGCYARDTHAVVNQNECFIQDKALSIVAYAIREWACKNGLSVYNEKSRKGFLRHVVLRKGAGTGEIIIGLVTNGGRPEGSRCLSQMLLNIVNKRIGALGTIVGIVQNVNTRDTNVVLGSDEYVWWGRPYLKELLGKIKFKLEMSTFFQVNPYQTPNLYNVVLNSIPTNSRVLDLYSGVGSIALWLSSKAKEVIGIEENKASVSAAKVALTLNKIKNVHFFSGDVIEMLPRFTQNEFECAVIDPPRKGIDEEGIESIYKSTLKRLVYVSCNPETLARDVRYLSKEFKLIEVTGVDMFPQTEHIESVALLERR